MTLNVAIPKKSEPCKKKKQRKEESWNFPFKVFGKKFKKKDTCQFLVKKTKKNPREMGRNKHHKFFNLYVD